MALFFQAAERVCLANCGRGGLYRFVVSESLLLSVLALLPGMVLFCFVYPFDPVHLSALGCACLVMILFSVFSAWWPAYKVARVNPVEAMREV